MYNFRECGQYILSLLLQLMLYHILDFVRVFTEDTTRQISPAVQAVMEMDIPVQYVELANEVHVMETGKEFSRVQDLYLCAMAIAESPEKQHELAHKVYQHQNAAKKGTQTQENIPEETLHCSSERIKTFEAKKVADKADVQQRFHCLLAENKKLKKRKLCRSCQKVELASSGVTFLPCGHFIVCEECAEKHDNCPACGKTIMGTVRTFLA